MLKKELEKLVKEQAKDLDWFIASRYRLIILLSMSLTLNVLNAVISVADELIKANVI